MRYLLVLLMTFLGASAFGDCVGLVYAMMNCTPYRCAAQFAGHEIEYEILGSFNENSCRYSEKDESGFTLCDIANEDFSTISNYLMQLLTKSRDNVMYEDITRLRTQSCKFYRVLGNSFVKKGMSLNDYDVRNIEHTVEMRIRAEEVMGLRSMFFDEEELKK